MVNLPGFLGAFRVWNFSDLIASTSDILQNDEVTSWGFLKMMMGYYWRMEEDIWRSPVEGKVILSPLVTRFQKHPQVVQGLRTSWWLSFNPFEKYAQSQIGSFPQGSGWK